MTTAGSVRLRRPPEVAEAGLSVVLSRDCDGKHEKHHGGSWRGLELGPST